MGFIASCYPARPAGPWTERTLSVNPNSARRRFKPATVAAAASVVAATLMFGGVAPAQGATTDPNPNALETADAALSRQAAEQGMVLLENRDQALPMARGGNVALFGVGAYQTVKGGTGSGSVNNRSNVSARQGLENAGYQVTTGDAYWSAMTGAYDDKYGHSAGGLLGPADRLLLRRAAAHRHQRPADVRHRHGRVRDRPQLR